MVDPSSRIVTATSMDGTKAYAEVTDPIGLLPGYMVVNAENQTDEPKHNVIVHCPLETGMVIDRRSSCQGVRVTPSSVVVIFDTLAPHETECRAVDFAFTHPSPGGH